MQQSGRMFSFDELEPKLPAWETPTEVPPDRKKLSAAIEAYAGLSIAESDTWRKNTRRYMSIEQLTMGEKPRRRAK